MTATRLNHVAVSALDLDESTRFYSEVFGMVPVPSYEFTQPVVWLRLGSTQFHLFQRPVTAPVFHHVAFEVEALEPVYREAEERGIFDDAFGYHCYELPDGSVQLYLRDPAGNLIEIDWPDVHTIDRSVVHDIRLLTDDVPQARADAGATLFLRDPSRVRTT